MFRLTIEGATTAELKSRLLAAAQDIGGAAVSGSTDKPAPKAATNPAPKTEKPAAPALDYKKDVGPLILKLADKSRPKAVEVLGKFGVAKGTELTPEQYPEFVAAVNAALEAPNEDLG